MLNYMIREKSSRDPLKDVLRQLSMVYFLALLNPVEAMGSMLVLKIQYRVQVYEGAI